MHVACGDHAEIGRRRAKAIGDLVLAAQGRIAAARHPYLRATALAMRDHRHVAQAVVQRHQRMTDHDDERAAADGGPIDVSRRDPQGFAQEGRGMLTGGEDAVDVGDLQPGIAHGVMDRLQMQRQLALVRQGADLIALVNAHNADCTAQLFHRSLPLASGYASDHEVAGYLQPTWLVERAGWSPRR